MLVYTVNKYGVRSSQRLSSFKYTPVYEYVIEGDLDGFSQNVRTLIVIK